MFVSGFIFSLKKAYDILLKKCMTSNIATRLQSTALTRMPYRSGSSVCWGCSGCSCGGCFFWCILLLGCLHVRCFNPPTFPSPSAPYTLVVANHVCFVVCACACVCCPCELLYASHLIAYPCTMQSCGIMEKIGITKLVFKRSTIFLPPPKNVV